MVNELRAWAEIRLDALCNNLKLAQERTRTPVMAVIKGDAHGHGAIRCGLALQEAGAVAFAVACLQEALDLRCAGIVRPILILGWTPVTCAASLAEYDLTQSVMSEEYAEALEYGHGGSDYFGFHYFHEAILGKCKPHIDVYEAIDMTAIGILGWKSVLNNSASYEIVDFRDKKAREIFRGDDWNPDPGRPCKDKPPCSICGKIEYTDEDIRKFEELHRK